MERAELTIPVERERQFFDVEWLVDVVVWDPFGDHPLVEIVRAVDENDHEISRRHWPELLEEVRDIAIDDAQSMLDLVREIA